MTPCLLQKTMNLTVFALIGAISVAPMAFASENADTAAPTETSDETQICKAIISSLPKDCKNLNATGKFGITLAKSYDCMFPKIEESFEESRSARVLVLLKRLSKHDLVNEVAKKWVEHRRWGPLNQQLIVDDLKAILNVKKRTGKEKVVISEKVILKTFKDLLFVGKGAIAPSQIYLQLLPKLTSFYSSVSISDTELAEAVKIGLNIVLRFSNEEEVKIPSKKITRISDLAHAVTLVEDLNALARSGKIDGLAWDKVAPMIAKDLNSIYNVQFSVVEDDGKIGKKKNSKKFKAKQQKNSDDSSTSGGEDTSSASEEDKHNSSAVNATPQSGKPTKIKSNKIIEISDPTGASQIFKSKSKNKGASGDNEDSDGSNGFSLMAVGLSAGAVVLLAGIGYAGYLLLMMKRNKESSEIGI